MLGPVLPLYVRELGGTDRSVGFITSSRSIGGLIFTLPSGFLAGRYGCKRVSLTGIAIYFIGCVWGGFVKGINALVFTRLLCGVAYVLYVVPAQTFVRLSVPQAMRGRVLSMIGGVYRIGGLLGPLAGGLLAQHLGFRAPFFIQAAAVAVAFPIVVAKMQSDPNDPDAQPPDAAARSATPSGAAAVPAEHAGLRMYVRQNLATLLPVAAGAAILAMVRGIRDLLVPLYASDLGLSRAQVGFVTAFSNVGEVLLFPLGGWMLDRIGRRPTGIMAQVIMAAGILVLGLAPPSSSSALWAGAVLGCGNALSSGLLMVLSSDVAPRGLAGQFTGAMVFISSLGGALGPVAVGAIAQATTLRTAMLLAAGAALTGAAFWGWLVPETGGRHFLAAQETAAAAAAKHRAEEEEGGVGGDAATVVTTTEPLPQT